MQGTVFKIRASKQQFYAYLGISIGLVLLAVWLMYQLSLGKHFWQGFFVELILLLFFVVLAMSRWSTTLQIRDGSLIITSFFVRQRVLLGSLVGAELYKQAVGRYPDLMLKLMDDQGGIVRINITAYEGKDLASLFEVLRPYIFIERVDKNFMQLPIIAEPDPNAPKMTVGRTMRGTLLFVLLPCLVVTIILVVWAIITNQPAFR